LVEGDHAAVDRLLRGRVDALSDRERLWSADHRLRAGDLLGARDELARLLDRLAARSDGADDADVEATRLAAELHTLLRRDGDLYGPLLASISPRAFLRHFAAAWTNAVAHHIDEAYVQAGILGVLDRVDLAALGDGDDGDVALAIQLLHWRSLAHVRTRRGEE